MSQCWNYTESIGFIRKELDLSGKKFRSDFPDNSNPPVHVPWLCEVIMVLVKYHGSHGTFNASLLVPVLDAGWSQKSSGSGKFERWWTQPGRQTKFESTKSFLARTCYHQNIFCRSKLVKSFQILSRPKGCKKFSILSRKRFRKKL